MHKRKADELQGERTGGAGYGGHSCKKLALWHCHSELNRLVGLKTVSLHQWFGKILVGTLN
jgi:hypothetical protein